MQTSINTLITTCTLVHVHVYACRAILSNVGRHYKNILPITWKIRPIRTLNYIANLW